MRKIALMSLLCLIGFFGCSKDEKPADPVVTPTPGPEAPPPVQGKMVVVHFKFESARLSKEDKKLIDAAIAERQPGSKMTIVGYTDSQGSKKYNQKLSEKRAKAVSKYLDSLKVENTWNGKGEDGLLNPDKTKADHQANRRAEIAFTVLVK